MRLSSCSSSAIKLISCEERSLALPPLQRNLTLISCPWRAACRCLRGVALGTSLETHVNSKVPSASRMRLAVSTSISLLGLRVSGNVRTLQSSKTQVPCIGSSLSRERGRDTLDVVTIVTTVVTAHTTVKPFGPAAENRRAKDPIPAKGTDDKDPAKYSSCCFALAAAGGSAPKVLRFRMTVRERPKRHAFWDIRMLRLISLNSN